MFRGHKPGCGLVSSPWPVPPVTPARRDAICQHSLLHALLACCIGHCCMTARNILVGRSGARAGRGFHVHAWHSLHWVASAGRRVTKVFCRGSCKPINRHKGSSTCHACSKFRCHGWAASPLAVACKQHAGASRWCLDAGPAFDSVKLHRRQAARNRWRPCLLPRWLALRVG